ncbi:MAG: hypothetical protein RIF33_21970 [Cyclobacteriaceae bacterium]
MRTTLLISLLLFETCHANAQELSQEYFTWIKQGPLNVMVRSVEVNQERNILTMWADTTTLIDPVEVRRLYTTWDSLSRAQEELGVQLADQLLLKFSQLALRPAEGLSIRLLSVIPALFSVEISMVNNQVTANVSFVGGKGEEPPPIELDRDYFDPSEHFLIRQPFDQAKKTVINVITEYLSETYGLRNKELTVMTTNRYNTQVNIEKRLILTERYSERIEINIFWFPIGDTETEMSYEIHAEYAAGLMKVGEFRDLKNEYFLELIAFNQLLKEEVYKVN